MPTHLKPSTEPTGWFAVSPQADRTGVEPSGIACPHCGTEMDKCLEMSREYGGTYLYCPGCQEIGFKLDLFDERKPEPEVKPKRAGQQLMDFEESLV